MLSSWELRRRLSIGCLLTTLLSCSAQILSFTLDRTGFGRRLIDHVILTLTDVTLVGCARKCLLVAECLSLNHQRSAGLCELNSANRTTADVSSILTEPTFVHSDISDWPMQMAGVCAGRPCGARQMCVPAEDSYVCSVLAPKTCEMVKQCSSNYADGEYWIMPETLGKKVRIYCHDMATDNPREYITLPSGNNTAYSSGTLQNVSPNTERRINFEKVAVNIVDMTIIVDDFTFSDYTGGDPIAFGAAGDCRGTQGTFNIDTRGSGLILDPSLVWQAVGYAEWINGFYRSPDGTQVTALCGGWCGECFATSPLKLQLNTNEDLPVFSAALPTCG